MRALHAVGAALVPPLCPACGRSRSPNTALCPRCARRLDEAEPLAGLGATGLDRAWSSAPHEGVARQLVAALKFRRLLPVAALMAERIEWLAPASLLSGTIVPAPTARLRTMKRGFDPAVEIAAALAECSGAPFSRCLDRVGATRQVGKRRGERVGRPPRFSLRDEAPRSVVLVDDVMTTGATLSAAAKALREGGAVRIVAVIFTRRL